MTLRKPIGIALIVALLLPFVGAAGELRNNPFRVPGDVGDSASRSPAVGAIQARPTLVGILLGDSDPLVNLDGNIIGVGEQSSGYLLVAVGPETATFKRGEDTVTLSLYPEGNTDE